MTGVRIGLGLGVVAVAAAGLWWLYAILTDRQIRALIARAATLERELPRYEWARRFEALCALGEHWQLARGSGGTWHVVRHLPMPALSAAGRTATEAIERAHELRREFTA